MKIKVSVKTNSKVQSVTKINEAEYKISLTKSPIENKANKELINLLKRYFKKNIKIVKGKNSTTKLIEVI